MITIISKVEFQMMKNRKPSSVFPLFRSHNFATAELRYGNCSKHCQRQYDRLINTERHIKLFPFFFFKNVLPVKLIQTSNKTEVCTCHATICLLLFKGLVPRTCNVLMQPHWNLYLTRKHNILKLFYWFQYIYFIPFGYWRWTGENNIMFSLDVLIFDCAVE